MAENINDPLRMSHLVSNHTGSLPEATINAPHNTSSPLIKTMYSNSLGTPLIPLNASRSMRTSGLFQSRSNRGSHPSPATIYSSQLGTNNPEPIDIALTLPLIPSAINLLERFASLNEGEGSKEERIFHLEFAIYQIQKEIHKIRESHGGSRRHRTHKRAHRNKRRHTRARK
jgi:hypothetical protein